MGNPLLKDPPPIIEDRVLFLYYRLTIHKDQGAIRPKIKVFQTIYQIWIGLLGPIRHQLMVILLPNLFYPIRLQTNHTDHFIYPLLTIHKKSGFIPWRIKEYQAAKN